MAGVLLGSVLVAAPIAVRAIDTPAAGAGPAPAGTARSTPRGGHEARATLAAAAYAAALERLREERYPEALESLRRLQVDFPAFERMPAVQARIAVLHEAGDAAPALGPFLDALDHRDEGDVEAAIERLERLGREPSTAGLADDALYLVAYFRLMDLYEFAATRETLLELGRRFPDTAYRDSAVYLDAIALEQLGDTDAARTALLALLERHTALALPFDFRWPKGNMLSRYWFDRAERRLDIIERRLLGASRLGERGADENGRLRLDVNLGGIDMTLSLAPSPLVRETTWLDAGLADRGPPPVGVYEGRVVGEAGSWVRAVVREDSITGLVEIDGERHRLLPANLVGTLDYYLPKPGGGLDERPAARSTLAELFEGADALVAPPMLGPALPEEARASGPRSDARAIPLSVVVDSRYDRYHAGDGLAVALNNLNVADGIYRGFGFSLALDEALTFDDERDPMAIGPVTLETLLRHFRDYRLAQSTLFEGSALTYLFSGNPKTDITLGLAWIDTLCRTDGYDVGVTTPSAFGDVLLTHELGHSLGALHDTDTACRAAPDYLMWPNISERTPTTLSPCSEESVRRAHARSCLLDTVDLALQLETRGDTARFIVTNPDSALGVEASLVIETATVRQGEWPSGCRARTPASADCTLGRIGPGQTHELVLPDSAGDVIGGTLHIASDVLELDPRDNVASVGGITPASGAGTTTIGGDGQDRGTGDGQGSGQGGDTGGGEGGTITLANGAGADGDDASNGPTLAGGGGGGAGGIATVLLLGGALLGRRRRLGGALFDRRRRLGGALFDRRDPLSVATRRPVAGVRRV